MRVNILMRKVKQFQRKRSLKLWLNFDISMTLGQEMILTLINTFSGSISCLHLAIFKSQAVIQFFLVSKISIVLAFSQVKAFVSKIDLVVK